MFQVGYELISDGRMMHSACSANKAKL